MITVLVVDDEAELRGDLIALIKEHEAFTIIGECENAYQAMTIINNEHPDVVFLDIKMPEITGIEMLGMLDRNNMPRIVFVTAYEEYAVEAFRLNALDYLLKPINKEDLAVTLTRLRENCQPQPAITQVFSTLPEFIVCYHNNTEYRIRVDDIIYASTQGTFGVVQIVVEHSEYNYHTPMTLTRLSEISPLKRCHGQHVINTKKILRMAKKPNNTSGIIHTISGQTVDIGRNFMKDFFKK
jgi:two-component system LytT family response regulator